MKYTLMRTTIFLLFVLVAQYISAQQYSRDVETIKTELLAHNKAVHVFDDWMRDPFITIGPDGYYYLTCTQQEQFIKYREASSIAMPLYRSKDLAGWEFLGYPYSVQDASNYEQYLQRIEARRKEKPERTGLENLRMWAPELHYVDGRWVIVYISNAGIGNLVMAEPGSAFNGPFTDWGAIFGRQHDPSIFRDDDGTCWLVSGCAQIQQLKPDLTGFAGEPVRINPSNRKMGHEGACIVKFEEKYIFFGTAWSRDTLRKGTYNLYYSVSDKLEGPYGERKFAGRFLGHGTPFQDREGRWWCTAFYNADRPPLTREEARTMDVSQSAYTINKQGLTLVPLEIKMVDGEVVVLAKDPDYRWPGAEEIQSFVSSGYQNTREDQHWKNWAAVPPMGWNSYDAYHGAITEDQFRACVDVLAEELLAYGWEYAVVDFCWYRPADEEWYGQPWRTFQLGQRLDSAGNFIPNLVMDGYGRVLPDPGRWPSSADGSGFKALADYVHSRGMKLGIHIMRGIPKEAVEKKLPVMGTGFTADQIADLNHTCPWMNHMYGVDIRKPGSQEYYNSLFRMYADWGVDFIKADDMMVPPYHRGEIEMMHRAILNSGRSMVLSLSCGKAPLSAASHLERHANTYRISSDFWDRWHDMVRMFELAEMWSPFIGEGTWPDADMIPIGNLCIGGYPGRHHSTTDNKREHESFFTEAEHLALMSLWCMIRSPLMWGGDPLTSSEWSKSFLKNKEVLSVNRNSENNRQIYERNNFRVWIADVPGTDVKYLGLFNLADNERELTFDFYWDLLAGPFAVRDLWEQEDIGIYENELTVRLLPHEGRLYRLTPR